MTYCLNRLELTEIIDHIVNKKTMNDDELKELFESAQYWQDQLICLSYLLSIILERKQKDGENCQKVIDEIYRLPDELFIFIQEFDSDFVDYMLRHTRNSSLSLVDDLVLLQNNMAKHLYDKTIRY